ncbi:MAG: hypothetical protein GMKNLPBB_00961 [Myxococcota bacterium]|nr:hypothetical protein [Myxococcota bacterium]
MREPAVMANPCSIALVLALAGLSCLPALAAPGDGYQYIYTYTDASGGQVVTDDPRSIPKDGKDIRVTRFRKNEDGATAIQSGDQIFRADAVPSTVSPAAEPRTAPAPRPDPPSPKSSGKKKKP